MPDTATRDLAWSPDGSTVAFVGNGLWTMAADGTDLQQVATTGAVDSRTPASSPDGNVLAFIARPFAGARPQLFVVSTSGDVTMLSSLQGAARRPGVPAPVVSRWGSIAFEFDDIRVTDEVFVATDGDVWTIDDRTDGMWDRRWTPDGSAIVYSAKIGDEQYQLFRTQLDDTAPVRSAPCSRARSAPPNGFAERGPKSTLGRRPDQLLEVDDRLLADLDEPFPRLVEVDDQCEDGAEGNDQDDRA